MMNAAAPSFQLSPAVATTTAIPAQQQTVASAHAKDRAADEDDDTSSGGAFGRSWICIIALVISIGWTCACLASQLMFIQRDMFYTPSGLPTLRKFEPGADKLKARARLVADTAEHHAAKTPHCDWVNGTDVQSSATALPVTLALHAFVAVILVLMILAHLQFWRNKLHASAIMNIGLIQVWIGLDTLSRSMDFFTLLCGYAFVLLGSFAAATGGICRFTEDGPGFSLFGTSQACRHNHTTAVKQPQEPVTSTIKSKEKVNASTDIEKQAEGLKIFIHPPADPTATQQSTVAPAVAAPTVQQAMGPPPPTPMFQQPSTGFLNPMQYMLPSLAMSSGYETPTPTGYMPAHNPYMMPLQTSGMLSPSMAHMMNPFAGMSPMTEAPPEKPPAEILCKPMEVKTAEKSFWRRRKP